MFCVLVDNRSRKVGKGLACIHIGQDNKEKCLNFMNVSRGQICGRPSVRGSIYLLPDSEFFKNTPTLKRKINHRYA